MSSGQTGETGQQKRAPTIGRRRFLKGMIVASGALAAGSFASGGDFLRAPELGEVAEQPIADLNDTADPINLSIDVTTGQQRTDAFSKRFFWPFKKEEDPFHRNWLIRVPAREQFEQLVRDSQVQQLPGYEEALDLTNEIFGAEGLMALNTTCVHLQCLVNYFSRDMTFKCPCHGSQYDVTTGQPIFGPAWKLGLKWLPKISLEVRDGLVFPLRNSRGQRDVEGVIGIGREPE